jgi:hypothetical protein
VASEDHASFADWAAGQMEIWSGRMGAREAAIEALLPFAAAAIAMTGFMLVAKLAG